MNMKETVKDFRFEYSGRLLDDTMIGQRSRLIQPGPMILRQA